MAPDQLQLHNCGMEATQEIASYAVENVSMRL